MAERSTEQTDAPEDTAASADQWRSVVESLDEASWPADRDYVASGRSRTRGHNAAGPAVFPGAVLLVGHRGKVVFHHASGSRSLVPDVTPLERDMVFDVASLTKAVVTTTLVMQLLERNKLKLDQKISQLLQGFGTMGKEHMSIRHLLTHSSGYPAHLPFYKRVQELDRGERAGIMATRAALEMVYQEIYRTRLEHLPGRVATYSDVGYLLLGKVVEVLSGGKPLDRLAQELIFTPLGMRSSGFIELAKLKRRGLAPVTSVIVPTADCPWRGKVLCGEVYDDNAWAVGGVAGHA
ncbi:MAG: beta-lactamase family protein, partial [Bdellovibrionales bacterium]|nr:beta-lactamase family protein [Bdellovibrionales bacterium]